MKIPAVILCVCILFVSAMPCCADNVADVCGNTTGQLSAGSDSHSDCSGTCSPFCICDSCGGFAAAMPVYYCRAEQTFPKDYQIFTSIIYSLLLPKYIWQPPRVS